MEIFLFYFCFLVALLIPVFLLFFAYESYVHKIKVWKIIVRLITAFFGYSITTLINLIFIIGTGGAHAKPENHDIFYLLMILFYVFIGWLLCSLVKGNIFKPWKFSAYSDQKSQTIFDKK